MAKILEKLFEVIDNNRVTLVLTEYANEIIDKAIIDRYREGSYIVSQGRLIQFYNRIERISKDVRTIRGISPKTLIIFGSILSDSEEKHLELVLPTLVNTKIIWVGCTHKKGYFYDLYQNSNDVGKFMCRWDQMYEDFPDYSNQVMKKLSHMCQLYSIGNEEMAISDWRSRWNLEWI